jgi:lysozyme
MRNYVIALGGRAARRTPAIRGLFLLLVVLGLLASAVGSPCQVNRRAQQIPRTLPPPCCAITAINASTGVVTAKVNANGNIFQFQVTNAALLNSLKVGQGVYANFPANQVSVDGTTVCCAITAPPAPPPPAPSASEPPPPAANKPAPSLPAAPAAAPLAVGAIGSTLAPPTPCCAITAIDTSSGVVTAKVNANGNIFQFKVTDAALLNSLKIGQGVYANFKSNQVSLDGTTACCAIITPPAPPPPAPPAGGVPPPAATKPATSPSAAPSAAPLAVGAIGSKLAPGTPCCAITAIDTTTGVVTAKVNATGKIFQFKVTDAALLNSLKIGQGVYANFSTMQVSLDGNTPCCSIISSSAPPPPPLPPAGGTSGNSPASPPTKTNPPPGSGGATTQPGLKLETKPGTSTAAPMPLVDSSLNPFLAAAQQHTSLSFTGPGTCHGSISIDVPSSSLNVEVDGDLPILSDGNGGVYSTPFLGCTMIVELYKGVQLQNGWSIVNAEFGCTTDTGVNIPPGSCQWISKPSGKSLQGQLSITLPHSFNPPQGTQPCLGANSCLLDIVGHIVITLRGRAGLDPYPPLPLGTAILTRVPTPGSASPASTAQVPTFSLPEARFVQDFQKGVTISDSTTGAVIYYTTDGSTPTTSSTRYSGPIPVSSTTTIKAMATASGMANSAIGTITYTVCPAVSVLEGVDVSDYQSAPIDWNKVRTSGRAFAYARASIGTSHVDTTFAQNYAAIKAAGLLRGAFHTFVAGVDGVMQANSFLSIFGTIQPGDLPPALDVSNLGTTAVSTLQLEIGQWMARVQAVTGRTPIVYSSAPLLQQALGSGTSVDPLWIANWGVTCPTLPGGAHQWVFWQYSSTGTVPGIQGQVGQVDLNRFNGTLADLNALARLSSSQQQPPSSSGTSTSGTTASNVSPVINEIETDNSTLHQFIELFNPGGSTYDLKGHCVVFRSATATSDTLLVSFKTKTLIPSKGYFLLALPNSAGPTPNATYSSPIASAGGVVAMRDGAANSGSVIDSVAYGSASNPFLPTASALAPQFPGTSISRLPNGSNTYNNSVDFQVTFTPTPGQANH